ncbi:MAG TPA: DUF4097 family beta strand repeat-containing protein [Clostridia bacterium]|nr:DUF4097 family beta strand repeat-containing protein [Clostridia bacterium]
MIRRARCFSLITVLIFFTLFFAGCTSSGENWSVVTAGRPVIGFTVEKGEDREIDPDRQNRLHVAIDNGNIRITRGNGSKLLIRETLRIKGPASKERLEELLESSRSKVDNSGYGINVDQKQSEEIKPLYGMADDLEIVIPAAINVLNISLKNGTISLSGLDGLREAELNAVNGQVGVYDSSSDSIKVNVENGNIDISDFSGGGVYDCGRGDIKLNAVSGSVDLTSVSGDADIMDTEGVIKCDISSGRLTVKGSSIGDGSDLYASTGSIDAELTDIDNTGKLTVKSADADIRLKMPVNKGYSLIAGATRGRVHNKMNPSPETLKKSPEGKVYGDVGGGGLSLDVYTDGGSITLF